MKKLSHREVQEVELNILVEFDKFCKKNNLYYTLSGGTLLGAIRHKGFIPWDDDIDVMMPRPDFDRLLYGKDLDTSDLPDYLHIASWKDKSLPFPFIKVLDSRTKTDVDFYNEKLNVNEIWIDVFPIDGNPDDDTELKNIFKKSLRLRKVLNLKLAKSGEGKTAFKRFFKPFLIQLFKVVDIYALCEKIDRLSKTYDFDKCTKVGGITWGYGPQERIDKKAFLTGTGVEFENGTFNAPSNYHEYLTGLYKDYMQLPPEEKRVIHGLDAYMK